MAVKGTSPYYVYINGGGIQSCTIRYAMRLNEKYVTAIKNAFYEVFQHGEIFLFGSRVDDTKKGGDIDLYLVVENSNLFRKKLKFLAKIKRVIGEQKIDVVFNLDENRIIEQEAKKWGIKL